MVNEPSIESITGSYDEVFREHEIYISPNRDRYTGGSEWSVCRDENELEAGLEFSIEAALDAARVAVNNLLSEA
jgi:hypothetical protein